MSHENLDYQNRIRKQGFRLTPQRQMILDAICEGGGHTTFDEIFARVQAKAPAVHKATLYRNLEFLCDLRLVVSADLGAGRKVYEICHATPHHHLVCRECGKIEELAHHTVEPFFAQIEAAQNFAVDMDHLILFGTCPDCRNNQDKSP